MDWKEKLKKGVEDESFEGKRIFFKDKKLFVNQGEDKGIVDKYEERLKEKKWRSS